MSSETFTQKRKAMDTECESKSQERSHEEDAEFPQFSLSIPSTDQQQPQLEPPFIIQLKDEHVEPEHEELVRLTLSTGSTYQSPPQKQLPPPPPESPPHPSVLQLMPPSFSSSPVTSPELLPHLSFSQLLSQFSSRLPEPPCFLVSRLRQNGILNLQPPALPPALLKSSLQPSLLLPSYSSQYIEPPPGFPFHPELPTSSRQPPSPEQKPQPPADQTQSPKQTQSSEAKAHGRGARRARNYKKPGWEPNIEPPYPWSSSIRAKVLSKEELLSKNIIVITGDLFCRDCKKQFQIEYDLQSKFSEVVSFMANQMNVMHDRAPEVWSKPQYLDCRFCGKSKCVEPTSKEKRNTNWLFLFLGQMIGHCNLTHLKYFCKYNNHHRTAAKDRLVYLTYTTLHCQLDPKASHLYKKNRRKSRYLRR